MNIHVISMMKNSIRDVHINVLVIMRFSSPLFFTEYRQKELIRNDVVVVVVSVMENSCHFSLVNDSLFTLR